jgi:flagellar biosynthesis protein FlhG
MNLNLILLFIILLGLYSSNGITAEQHNPQEATQFVYPNTEALIITNNTPFHQRGFTSNKFQGSEELIMKDLTKAPASYSNVYDDIFYKQRRNGTNQIIVLSSRLGMGKSTLSLYLSGIFTEDGKRVLLLDMDPVDSALSQIVQNPPSNQLSKTEWPAEYKESGLVSLNDNLDFLSNIACNKNSFASPSQISGKLRSFKAELSPYNYIIIDTHTGLNEINLSLLQDTDTAILITTPDATSVFETYSLIKAASTYLSEKKLYLVINKSIDADASLKAHEELNFALRHFLSCDISLLGIIPDDSSLSLATDKLAGFGDEKELHGALAIIQQVSQRIKNFKSADFAKR